MKRPVLLTCRANALATVVASALASLGMTQAVGQTYRLPITIRTSTPAAQPEATPVGSSPSATPARPVQTTPSNTPPSAGLQPRTVAPRMSDTPSSVAMKSAMPPGAAFEQSGTEAASEPVEESIEVAPGSQKLIALPGTPARVALADPDIAEVTVLRPVGNNGRGAALLIVAKQPGSSSLLVWQRGQDKPAAYRLTVNAPALVPLSSVPGVNVQSKGNAVRLEGKVNNVASYQQLRDNLSRSTVAGKPVELTDATTLSTSGTVQVDVKVVEFSRNDIQRLGINFTKINGDLRFGFGNLATGGSGSGSTSSAVSQALNIAYSRSDPGNLSAQLNALQSEGVARVLAEPTLVAQSGQSASFLAGGEIPIPVPSGTVGANSFTIQFKEFGIRLNFTPTILSNRTIALKVAPEVSDLDKANAISVNNFSIPAILTRRAETTVELGEGESFVIGGLISSNINSVVQKLPILADLPILGGFFRSVAYEKQDKELLIIATPRFVKPRAKNAPSLPLPGNQANPVRPSWGQMFLPASDGSLPGFSR